MRRTDLGPFDAEHNIPVHYKLLCVIESDLEHMAFIAYQIILRINFTLNQILYADFQLLKMNISQMKQTHEYLPY